MAERYILLPDRGLRARPERAFAAREFLLQSGDARSTRPPLELRFEEEPTAQLRVLDSIHEDGPKLIEAEPVTLQALRRRGFRYEPLVTYRLSRYGLLSPPTSGQAPSVDFEVLDAVTQAPLAGAWVAVFTDPARHQGAEGLTDSQGRVGLALGILNAAVPKLLVHPPLAGYWGHSAVNAQLSTSPHRVILHPVSAQQLDALRSHLSPPQGLAGDSVRVGIVDAGVDNTHPDLAHVTRGRNTATGEPRGLWQDNGLGHGTHVAGVVGSRNATWFGCAPGAELVSLRAFAQNSSETSNYEILKAILSAFEDEDCHVVNLSVSGEARPDETLRRCLAEAHERGVLCVVATGNEGSASVSSLAGYAFDEGLSVGAMGRAGTFPADSLEASFVSSRTAAHDPDAFVASFSNRGKVSVIAPGVGVLSTVPGGGHGPMSGTSMACPVVSGMAARWLGEDLVQNGANAILRQPANAARTLKMITLFQTRARKLFNDPNSEGDGLIPP
jgi:subtilisin